MSGGRPAASPESDPGGAQPNEVDAQELLDASHRAIAAARREVARLMNAQPLPHAQPGDEPEDTEVPGL